MDIDNTIPEEEIQSAWEECMKDPEMGRYFRDAPESARAYIRLQFYAVFYADQLDADAYARSLEALVEGLDSEAIKYLVPREQNEETRAWLNGLLPDIVAREREARRLAAAVPDLPEEKIDAKELHRKMLAESEIETARARQAYDDQAAGAKELVGKIGKIAKKAGIGVGALVVLWIVYGIVFSFDPVKAALASCEGGVPAASQIDFTWENGKRGERDTLDRTFLGHDWGELPADKNLREPLQVYQLKEPLYHFTTATLGYKRGRKLESIRLDGEMPSNFDDARVKDAFLELKKAIEDGYGTPQLAWEDDGKGHYLAYSPKGFKVPLAVVYGLPASGSRHVTLLVCQP